MKPGQLAICRHNGGLYISATTTPLCKLLQRSSVKADQINIARGNCIKIAERKK